jgi:hypothetical protein
LRDIWSKRRVANEKCFIFNAPGSSVPPSISTKTVKKRTPKHPCVSCERGVVSRSRPISCDMCEKWTHARCSGSISDKVYDQLVAENISFNFICNTCLIQSLQFNVYIYEEDLNQETLILKNSKFVSENDFDYACFQSKGLHCIHLNTRSLLPNISEMRLLAVKTNAKIIAISETWLDETVTDNEINIPGYSVIRQDRNREGGGTCIYINSQLAFNRRPDLNVPDLEICWIEFLLPKTKPIIVGSCYRTPEQSILTNYLTKLLLFYILILK